MNFFILFDDLDVDFELSNEEHCRRIMNLIRTVSTLNNNFPDNSHILLFLRDDVISHLAPKYNDSAKIIESHKVEIKWYSHSLNKINDNDVPLKKLVNQRIKIAFEKKGITISSKSVPWDFLIEADIGGSKSSFKYILDYTFYKPRDFVLFLNTIGDEAYNYPLSNNDIDKVLSSYCYKLKTEVLSELSLNFNNDKEKNAIYDYIFQHIANDIKVNKDTTYPELVKYIDDLHIFKNKGEEVIDKLWNYSLIGYSDPAGDIYYKHREEVFPDTINKANIVIPSCIRRLYKL